MFRLHFQKTFSRGLTMLMVGLLLSCGAPQHSATDQAASIEQLQDFLDTYPALDVQAELEKFLFMSDDMKAFSSFYVRPKGTASRRIQDIHNAINDPSRTIEYKADAHYTADEAFDKAQANCLSYSALFIAMGRHVNLNLSFQEVDLPPSWSLGEKDLLLRFRHVNVIGKTGAGRNKIIDFRMDRFSHFYPSRTISDLEALSLQFNNLAVDAMFEDDWPTVFKYLHSAIKADPKKVVAWGNLGLALRRINRLALAERAYLKALSVERRDYSVMTNLANLYRITGRLEEAKALAERSSSHRKRNPYYHFANAQRDFRKKNYTGALEHLILAKKINDREGNFAQLEAIIYWEQGLREQAIATMELAYKWEEGARTSELIDKRLKDWRRALAAGEPAKDLKDL
ncbi:hypothetical protein [uncultured Pseudoteredinibacter sp.]|uniref:hypothetical protein n=1 Tax=uncultured Pseudoteredinibacter sp. TaxID=1641701 RepID=UPI002624888C|nr:hypothetical protein [uncultured Pseudoteredinibacter sp.]